MPVLYCNVMYAQWGFQEALGGRLTRCYDPPWVVGENYINSPSGSSPTTLSPSAVKKSEMKLFFIAAFALFVLSMLDEADSSAYDKIVAHSRIRARKEG